MTRYVAINSDFTCRNCGNYVSAASALAGVNHRNHCPYCLWSRHLDLYQAGDRMAACKAPMQPVGLTLKRRYKKYASASNGELMLVHLCTGCGQVSINRIAADDLAPVLLEVLALSSETSTLSRERFRETGITLLGKEDQEVVYRQIYGASRIQI